MISRTRTAASRDVSWAIVSTILVGSILTLFALAEGIISAHRAAAHADNVTIKSAQFGPLDTPSLVAVRKALQDAHATEVTLEYEDLVPVERLVAGVPHLENISLRAVDPAAWAVHHVRIASGRMPAPGERGVVVGARLVARMNDLQLGGRVTVGRHSWPVIGILEAQRSIFDSEIWCDRVALASEYPDTAPTLVTARVAALSARTALATAIAALGPAYAFESEPAAFEEKLRNVLSTPDVDLRIAIVTAACACFALSFLVRSLRQRWKLASATLLLGVGLSASAQLLTFGFLYGSPLVLFSPRLTARALVCFLGLVAAAVVLAYVRALLSRVLKHDAAKRWASLLGVLLLGCGLGVVVTFTAAVRVRMHDIQESGSNPSFLSASHGGSAAEARQANYPEALIEQIRTLPGAGPLIGVFRYDDAPATEDTSGHRFNINAADTTYLQQILGPPFGEVDPAELAQWNRDPEGVLVSTEVQRQTGWKVGDTAVIKSPTGEPFPARVSGLFAMDFENRKVIFHPAYYARVTKDACGACADNIAVQCAPLGTPCEVAAAIRMCRAIEQLFQEAGYSIVATTAADSVERRFRFVREACDFLLVGSLLIGFSLCICLAYVQSAARGTVALEHTMLAFAGGAAFGVCLLCGLFHRHGISFTLAYMMSVPVTAGLASVSFTGTMVLGAITTMLKRTR